MKSILIIIACAIAMPIAVVATSSWSELYNSKDYVCWKCDAKIEHICPNCHGHYFFDRFGNGGQDGKYVRACSGCADQRGSCCRPPKKK